MTAFQEPSPSTPSAPSPRSSATPLLPNQQGAGDVSEQSAVDSSTDPKAGGKRRFFGLGKKKDGDNQSEVAGAVPSPVATSLAASSEHSSVTMREPSPVRSPGSTTAALRPAVSPSGSPNNSNAPLTSPRFRSSSPGLHSPASSQIFERNVQETASLSGELSPAIPAHIQTEDHIPAVLEASSLAITDNHLNPDEVEIVTHAAHQPAAANVAGTLSDSLLSPSTDDVASHGEADDSASNYGSIDTTDVRRLSFISFADVVQAEHAETSRDSLHLMSLSSTTNRSPSPIRSPASSHVFGTSPPTSGATSLVGMDAVSAKGIRTPGSPTAHSPPGTGELTIETMRQALRKTGSGDLSGARSQPLSAVSMEDASSDAPPFR